MSSFTADKVACKLCASRHDVIFNHAPFVTVVQVAKLQYSPASLISNLPNVIATCLIAHSSSSLAAQ